MRFVAIQGLAVACSLVACTSFRDKLENVNGRPCDDVLFEYSKLSVDPQYKQESRGLREQYEMTVASCYLERRRPEKAVDLSKAWTDDVAKTKIAARAHAQLGQEQECRAAIAALAAHTSTDFFTDWPEFKPYSSTDWFIGYAIDAWARSQTPPLEQFVRQLAGRGGGGLLPLNVAAADAQRPAGDWAVWTGMVRSGNIDRDAQQTILVAEGVDVQEELSGADVAVKRSDWGEVQLTRTNERYSDVFVPNGRVFIVKYPKVREQLVNMKTIVAVGRYSGRTSEKNVPELSALLVMERSSREHEGHAR
jgi:hypothetical protein